MQNYVEQEGVIGEVPSATGGGVTGPSAGQSIERWALGVSATLVATLAGWIYKNRRSGQTLEDTTNEVTVVTIRQQQERIKELEDRNRDLLREVFEANQVTLGAQRSANNAEIQADTAKDAAARASAAAEIARTEAESLRATVLRQAAYIKALRASMKDAGLTPPDEPT